MQSLPFIYHIKSLFINVLYENIKHIFFNFYFKFNSVTYITMHVVIKDANHTNFLEIFKSFSSRSLE